MQRGMSSNEAKVVGLILMVIFVLSFFNLRRSEVLARDVQRKNDLKHMAAGLDNYRNNNGMYPLSQDGKIISCGEETYLRTCEWGEDSIGDYLKQLPRDPSSPKHIYIYLSNGRDYQFFTALERDNDDEYNKKVVGRGLYCGEKICSFGLGSGNIPLELDLESLPPDESTPSALPNDKK